MINADRVNDYAQAMRQADPLFDADDQIPVTGPITDGQQALEAFMTESDQERATGR